MQKSCVSPNKLQRHNKTNKPFTKQAGIVVRTNIKAGGTFLEDLHSLFDFSPSSETAARPVGGS